MSKRAPIKIRKQTAADRAAEQLDAELDRRGYSGSPGPAPIPVYRGDKNIKPPTSKEIQGMKNKAFMRKQPGRSAQAPLCHSAAVLKWTRSRCAPSSHRGKRSS